MRSRATQQVTGCEPAASSVLSGLRLSPALVRSEADETLRGPQTPLCTLPAALAPPPGWKNSLPPKRSQCQRWGPLRQTPICPKQESGETTTEQRALSTRVQRHHEKLDKDWNRRDRNGNVIPTELLGRGTVGASVQLSVSEDGTGSVARGAEGTDPRDTERPRGGRGTAGHGAGQGRRTRRRVSGAWRENSANSRVGQNGENGAVWRATAGRGRDHHG